MGTTLYYGTYRDRLDSILKHGLGGTVSSKAYPQSKSGFVYLASDPIAAQRWAHYAESCDSLDDVVVLAVDGSKLDPELLDADENIKIPAWCPECETEVVDRSNPQYRCYYCGYEFDGDLSYQYAGVIPPSAIKLYNEGKLASKTSSYITIPLGKFKLPWVKTALSIPELISATNAFSVKRRPGCKAVLTNSDPKQLFLQYKVKCQESYSNPAGHDVRIQFDVAKVEETQNANDLDVKVSCSCEAFTYWSAAYNLNQRDSLLGTPLDGALKAPTQKLDLRTNFVLCVAPGTSVLMADGTEKLIEDVQTGDRVITHKGRARKVTATLERASYFNEEAIEVRAKGASEPLIVSTDHPLAVVRGNNTCFCGCGGQLESGYRGEKWSRKYKKGHNLNRPPRKLSLDDLAEIRSSCENQYVLTQRFGVGQATISRVQKKRVYQDDPNVEDRSQGKLDWVSAETLSKNEYLYFPKIKWEGTTEVDLNFASLLGYYLAEGNPIFRKEKKSKLKSGRPATKGRICDINGDTCRVFGINFTLNQDEIDTLGFDIKFKLVKVLGDTANIQIKHRSYSGKKWLNVVVNDSKLAVEMIRLAGCGSLKKQLIPEVFTWNKSAIQELLVSYALGDGHFDAKGQQYVYSISQPLISQISTILFSLGVWHGHMYQDWQGVKGTVKKKNRYHRLYWDYRKYPQILEAMKLRLRPHVMETIQNVKPPCQEHDYWEEGFLRRLNSTTRVKAPEKFYDLTVEEDESFIANGVVVHNCKHLKTVSERILPSVQHNIIKIIRERTVEKNKNKRETPETLKKKQDDMKKRRELQKLRTQKNTEVQEKLLEALRKKEEERMLEEQDEAVVERTEPATDISTPLTVDTPKTEDVTLIEPEGDDDLTGLVEQEEHKLQEKEHSKLQGEPHLHTGLPYEVEGEKQEHGHNIPTDKDLMRILKKKKETQSDNMKNFVEKNLKRRRSFLESSLLASLAEADDDSRD